VLLSPTHEPSAIDEQSSAPLQAVENAVLFSAVSELSGSFRERQRWKRISWINVLNEAKHLNGLNVFEQ
jgi:hypothetical protein